MKTPIVDFVKNYLGKTPIRLHMPAHKGKGDFCEKYDVTEINGADVLYSAEGIILESENNATKLFNTAHTFYSCEGSTLCVKAMLKLATQGVKNPCVIATRNCHVAFINACALLGIKVIWLYGKRDNLCSLEFDFEELKSALKLAKNLCAVYITSPDYLGKIQPIEKIAKICNNEHISLLVDNAHASYSAFIKDNFHPIKLGATMCCDSAHKTLPTLTGGAYLHISSLAKGYLEKARDSLSLFASTSPSYLILQSLDNTNLYLYNNAKEFDLLIEKINFLKLKLANFGYEILSGEPLKLVINIASYGYTYCEFYRHLQKYNVEPEMVKGEFCVFMLSPQNTQSDLNALENSLLSLPKKQPLQKKVTQFSTPITVLSIREATFRDCREIDINSAEGSICAKSVITCPPAIPLIVSGELVTKEIICLLNYYGVKKIKVIKN